MQLAHPRLEIIRSPFSRSVIIFIFSLLLLATSFQAQSAGGNIPLGTWSCWNIGTFEPCQQRIFGVDMQGANYGWAVGEDGVAMKWNGSVWTQHPIPDQGFYSLYDVSIVSPTNVWAVGGFQVIDTFSQIDKFLHWDGTSWSLVPTPSEIDVSEIDMISATDGWAVGGDGILRWNGTNWTAVSGFTKVFALDMISATDGWISALANGEAEKQFYRWNGTTFNKVTVAGQSESDAREIVALSANDVWATGVDGQIWHWNGTAWFWESVTSETLSDLYMKSSTEGWAMRFDKHFYWDGVSWEEGSQGGYAAFQLNGVARMAGLNGILHEWNGEAWFNPDITPSDYVNYRGVDMLSATDAWAVGSDGVIARWDGATWNQVSSPMSEQLNSVDIVTANNIWAVGENGTIVHWNGSSWTAVPSPTNDTFNDIHMRTANDGWIVGHDEDGTGVMQRWNGSSWTVVAIPTTESLKQIDATSATNVWAVGSDPVVLRLNGGNWETVPLPSEYDYPIYSLDMVSENEGWVAGTDGVLSWDGVDLSFTDTVTNLFGTVNNFRYVQMEGSNNGWAVTAFGGMYHWDGANWEFDSARTQSYSNSGSKFIFSGNSGFLFGGTIVQWDTDHWQPVTPFPSLPIANVIIPSREFIGIEMLSSTNGWAAARWNDFTSHFYHWDGQNWTQYHSEYGPGDLDDFDMYDAKHGWATTGHAGFQWDGREWESFSFSQFFEFENAFLGNVSMAGPEDVWFAGYDINSNSEGLIVHWDGSTWEKTIVPSREFFRDIAMVSPTDGWVTGDNGTLMRWNGMNWQEQFTGEFSSVSKLSMYSTNAGWMNGRKTTSSVDGPTLQQWNGSGWQELEVPFVDYIRDFEMTSSTTGWVAGFRTTPENDLRPGYLLYWDGTAWTIYSSPGNHLVNALSILDNGSIWSVTEAGQIIYNPTFSEEIFLPIIQK